MELQKIRRIKTRTAGLLCRDTEVADRLLAIVLRGDLAEILTFARRQKDPAFLEQKAVLEEPMGKTAVSEAQKRKKPRSGGFVGIAGIVGCGGKQPPSLIASIPRPGE